MTEIERKACEVMGTGYHGAFIFLGRAISWLEATCQEFEIEYCDLVGVEQRWTVDVDIAFECTAGTLREAVAMAVVRVAGLRENGKAAK